MSITFFTTNAEGKEVAEDLAVQMANNNAFAMQAILFPSKETDHAGTCSLETAMAELLRVTTQIMLGAVPMVHGQDSDYVRAKVGYLNRLVLTARKVGATDLRWVDG